MRGSELAPDPKHRDARQAVASAQQRGQSDHHTRAVSRELSLELGSFVKKTLEEQAHANDVSVPALLRGSALYYLFQRDAERLAWRIPRFARSSAHSAAGIEHKGRLEVTLDLEDDVWRCLEAESEQQRVPLARLLEHAALLFMNDLACGRMGARLSARR
jgi:hypothetical protein